jgi:phage gp36-like protein
MLPRGSFEASRQGHAPTMSAPLYTSPEALVAAFGETELVELTDRATPRANQVDEDVALQACERASVEINAALATRYTLPLAQVPALLSYLALDLARFYLYDREPPKLVQMRFDSARASLLALATGKQALGPDVAGLAVRPAPQDLPVMNGGAKDFARGAW